MIYDKVAEVLLKFAGLHLFLDKKECIYGGRRGEHSEGGPFYVFYSEEKDCYVLTCQVHRETLLQTGRREFE